ncbi:MAG: peptidoglycan editing factor PgeF [Myxococcales bacterium]|nr:peptidoglycan editing factor PgeF [Myxococcales bacterium]
MTHPLESRLLASSRFSHGFFTREGGVSPAPFDSLNMAASVGDDPTNVRTNVSRAAAALGVPASRLYYLSQVHGVDAVTLTGDEVPDDVVHLRGDITLSRVAGVACGVRSADCGTLLIGDRSSGAVCAVHSGWRGTVSNAAASGIRALRDLVGGAGDLVVAIGPLIEACCFEVGDDVAAELAACSKEGEAAVDRTRAKPHVDLRRILDAQLAEAGVAPDAIEHVRGCTVCDRERFFSFRRDGKASGRLLAAIVAR